jgi:hypothetical protein
MAGVKSICGCIYHCKETERKLKVSSNILFLVVEGEDYADADEGRNLAP